MCTTTNNGIIDTDKIGRRDIKSLYDNCNVEDYIVNFSLYCKILYEYSLKQQSRTTNNNDNDDNDDDDHVEMGNKVGNDDKGAVAVAVAVLSNEDKERNDFEVSKIVLEAFEYQLLSHSSSASSSAVATGGRGGGGVDDSEKVTTNNTTTTTISKEYETFVSSDRVQKCRTELELCGFFFIQQEAKIDNSSGEEKCRKTTSLPYIIPYEIVMQYYNERDIQRKAVHKLQMKYRIQKLWIEIHNFEKKKKKRNNPLSIAVFANDNEEKYNEDSFDMTRKKYTKQARTNLRQFIKKYKNNIGSHSFLGGLKMILQKQLDTSSSKNSDNNDTTGSSDADDSNNLILWTFDGVVLTESCFSTTSLSSETDNDNNYVEEAIGLLSSFACYYSNSNNNSSCINDQQNHHLPCDIEITAAIESKDSSNNEYESSSLSFHVDPNISDGTIKSLLYELPSKNQLEAKPSGTFRVMSVYNNNDNEEMDDCQATKRQKTYPHLKRTNINGELDESFVPDILKNTWCDIL